MDSGMRIEILLQQKRAEWLTAEPAERARWAAEWLKHWAAARGYEQEAEKVPAWDGVSTAPNNASWRAFADAVHELRRTMDGHSKPALAPWEFFKSGNYWFRDRSNTHRRIASVYWEHGAWSFAVDRADGTVERGNAATPEEARAKADEWLAYYGWALEAGAIEPRPKRLGPWRAQGLVWVRDDEAGENTAIVMPEKGTRYSGRLFQGKNETHCFSGGDLEQTKSLIDFLLKMLGWDLEYEPSGAVRHSRSICVMPLSALHYPKSRCASMMAVR